MTKNQLHQLVDEFSEWNQSTDIGIAVKLCTVLMYLENIGHEVIADFLANQEYVNAHTYIDKMEGHLSYG